MALLLETARLREVGPDDEFPDPEPDIDPMREFNAEAIYDPADAAVFRRVRDQWGEFSNMAGGYPIEIDGVTFRSSEALYQALRFPNSPELQAKIGELNGMAAKRLAHNIRTPQDEALWRRGKRVDAMRVALAYKFEKNPKLIQSLLDTGNKPIVEYSARDPFWGAKPVGDKLVGQNVLGKLLERLRSNILIARNSGGNVSDREAILLFAGQVTHDLKINGKTVIQPQSGTPPPASPPVTPALNATRGQHGLIYHDRGDTARSAIVIAGPGSGKTFSIVHHVARQMVGDVEVPLKSNEMKVVAFNGAAAEEISSRIMSATGGVVPEVQTLHDLAREIIQSDGDDGREWVRRNRINYDAQLTEAIERLKKPRVRGIFQGRLKEIIVDEFQDINDEMQKMLLWLKGENTALILVGDPDQTIYEFTGAKANRMAYWRDNILPKDTAVYELDINRRSTANIVDLSQRLINYDKNRINLQVMPHPKAPQGEPWTVKQYTTSADEAIAIADDISKRWLNDRSIAVFARDNAELEAISTALDGKRIPWVVTGANGEVSSEGVVLSTIHRVKGKEWNHVYVTGVNREPWDRRRIHGASSTPSERRLLYVAITRAAKSVHISTSGNQPSRLIAQLQQNPPGYVPPKRPEEIITEPIIIPKADEYINRQQKLVSIDLGEDYHQGLRLEHVLHGKEYPGAGWIELDENGKPTNVDYRTDAEKSLDPKQRAVRNNLINLAQRIEKALAAPGLINDTQSRTVARTLEALEKVRLDNPADFYSAIDMMPDSPMVAQLENVRIPEGMARPQGYFNPIRRMVQPYSTVVSNQNFAWGAAFKFVVDPATGQPPKNPVIISIRPSNNLWTAIAKNRAAEPGARKALDEIVEGYMNALHDSLKAEGIQMLEVNGATIEKTFRILATNNPDPRASTGRDWSFSLAIGDEIYSKAASMPGKRGKRDRMNTGGGLPTAAQRNPTRHPEDVALFQGDGQGRGVAAIKYAIQDDIYQVDADGQIIYDTDGNRVPVDFEYQERGMNGADGTGIISESAARKIWRAQTDERWNGMNSKVQISMAVTPREINGRMRGMIKALITILPDDEWKARMEKLGHAPDTQMLISTDSMPSERASKTVHTGKVIWHKAHRNVVDWVPVMGGLSMAPTLRAIKDPEVLIDMDRTHIAGNNLRILDNAFETPLSLANQEVLSDPTVIDPAENEKFVPGDPEYDSNAARAEEIQNKIRAERTASGKGHPAASPGTMELRGTGMASGLKSIRQRHGGADGLILPTVRAIAQSSRMLMDDPPPAGHADVRIIERRSLNPYTNQYDVGYDVNLMFSPEDLQNPQIIPYFDGHDNDDKFNVAIGKDGEGRLWLKAERRPTSIDGGHMFLVSQETVDRLMAHGLPLLDWKDNPHIAIHAHRNLAELDTRLVNPEVDTTGWIDEIVDGLTSKDPKERLRAQQRFVGMSVGRGVIGSITLPGQAVILSDWIVGPEDVEYWRANISGSIDVEVTSTADVRPVKDHLEAKLVKAVKEGGYTRSDGVKMPINRSLFQTRDGYFNAVARSAYSLGAQEALNDLARKQLGFRKRGLIEPSAWAKLSPERQERIRYEEQLIFDTANEIWAGLKETDDLFEEIQIAGRENAKAFRDGFESYAEDTPMVKSMASNKRAQVLMAETMENVAASVSNGPWQWLTAATWDPDMAKARLAPDAIYYVPGVHNIAMDVNTQVRKAIGFAQEDIARQKLALQSKYGAHNSHAVVKRNNEIETDGNRAVGNHIDDIVRKGLARAQQVPGYEPAMFYGALKRSEAITRSWRNTNDPIRGDDETRMFDAARSRMYKSMAGTPEEVAYFSKPKAKLDFTIRAFYTPLGHIPQGGDHYFGPWSKLKRDAPDFKDWEDIRTSYHEVDGVPRRATASSIRFHPAGFLTPERKNMLGNFTQIDDAVTARQLHYLSMMGYEFQWIEDVKGIGADNHLGVFRAVKRYSMDNIPDEQMALWARLHFEEGIPLEHMPPMYTPIENWNKFVHPSGLEVEIIDGQQKLSALKGPNRVLVAGSREFANRDFMFQQLDKMNEFHPITTIIHGDARGADRMAGEWANSRGVPIEIYPADWEKDGRSAGFKRNERMMDEGNPTRVIGFTSDASPTGSRGTKHMLNISRKRHRPTYELTPDNPLDLPTEGLSRKLTPIDPYWDFRVEWENIPPPDADVLNALHRVRQAQGQYLGNQSNPRVRTPPPPPPVSTPPPDINAFHQRVAAAGHHIVSTPTAVPIPDTPVPDPPTIRLHDPADPTPIETPPIPPSVEPVTDDEKAKKREQNRAKAAATQEEPPKISDTEFDLAVEEIRTRPTAGKRVPFGKVKARPSELERNHVGGRKDSALLLDTVFEEMMALRRGVVDNIGSTFVMHQGKAYPFDAVPSYVSWERRIRKMIWMSPTVGHFVSMEEVAEAWIDLKKWQGGRHDWRMTPGLQHAKGVDAASALLLKDIEIKAEARFIKEDTLGVWRVTGFKETNFGREPIFEHTNGLTTEIRGRVRPSAMITAPLSPGVAVSLRLRLTGHRRKKLDRILAKAAEPYEVFGGDVKKMESATQPQIEREYRRVLEARRANEMVYRIVDILQKDYRGDIGKIGNVNITPGTVVAVDELLDLAYDVKEGGQLVSRMFENFSDNEIEVLVRTGIRRGEIATWEGLGFKVTEGPQPTIDQKRDFKTSYLGHDWDEFQNIVRDIHAEWNKGNFLEGSVQSLRLRNLWILQQVKRRSRLYITHTGGADVAGRALGRVIGVVGASVGGLRATGFVDMNGVFDDIEIRRAWHNIRTAAMTGVRSYVEREHHDLYNRIRVAADQARKKGQEYDVKLGWLDNVIGDEDDFQSFNRTKTGLSWNIIWRVNWYTALTVGIGATATTRLLRKKGVRIRKRWIMSAWGIDKDDLCANNARQGWINDDKPFRSGHTSPPAHPGCRCRVQIQSPGLNKIEKNPALEKLTKPTFINIGRRRNYAQRPLARMR